MISIKCKLSVQSKFQKSNKQNKLKRQYAKKEGKNNLQDEIVSLCKRRGFVFPSSELYGGLSGSFDYGPLGVQLKKNIRDLWWEYFVERRADCVGVETPIIMRQEVWHASGHIAKFTDPLVECKECGCKFRADHLTGIDTTDIGILQEGIKELKEFDCSKGGKKCSHEKLGDVKFFNLLFKSSIGPVENDKSVVYLRPETAQGIFLNFHNINGTMRKPLPFGIAQVGKSFRNEIDPRDYLFRMREFEQMEMEFFCLPETANEWYEFWKQNCMDFLKYIGIEESNLVIKEHDNTKLAHYANSSADIEFLYPTGWGELWGIANRGDFDMRAHEKATGKDLRYKPQDGEKFHPYVIEPAIGLDRLVYAILVNGYKVEEADSKKEGGVDTRVVLKLDKKIAPFHLAVLPLMKKQPLLDLAEKIRSELAQKHRVDYDITGTIGKRYRRHDEIGTPYCLTIDFESLEDNHVTIRNRDTMSQERISIDSLSRQLDLWYRK